MKRMLLICTYLSSMTVDGGFLLVPLCAVSACFTGLAAYSIIYLSSPENMVFDEFGVVDIVYGM